MNKIDMIPIICTSGRTRIDNYIITEQHSTVWSSLPAIGPLFGNMQLRVAVQCSTNIESRCELLQAPAGLW